MTLATLIALPFAGGLLCWLTARYSVAACRWIALLALGIGLAWTLAYWNHGSGPDGWILEEKISWIPSLGIHFQLSLDGLSLLLIALTFFLGLLSVLISWHSIHERVGFFHFNLLWILAGTVGVFLATDLFLFFFFWEMMVLPMFLLIGIWGHANRNYAAVKFFLFTQASGLLLLVAIVGLAFAHQQQTGQLTFDYNQLLGSQLQPLAEFWLMLGFFIAFAVKLPAFPFHTWLADAHSEAPTAGSVILAGILLKTGGYGLLRFVLPLFPDASETIAPYAVLMGVIGILYGALLAFAQTDLKRLIAYTSVSHMGFILLGVFAWNEVSQQGTVIQMIAHGLSTGALFILAGFIYERIHTRDLDQMGGFRTLAPRLAAFALFFAMASLGLPGTGNFIGEFLILLGTFREHMVLTTLAATGLVAAAVYSLWIVQKVFHGKPGKTQSLPDLNRMETLILTLLLLGLVGLGLYPRPVLDVAAGPLEALRTPVYVTAVETALKEDAP
ncbi:MAG: NADH-quinone oxidoreductase subunit M [Opitutales bacterium]|nr:NADH-quinone oxidoreductase subunit M [Opitutales bacterium]